MKQRQGATVQHCTLHRCSQYLGAKLIIFDKKIIQVLCDLGVVRAHVQKLQVRRVLGVFRACLCTAEYSTSTPGISGLIYCGILLLRSVLLGSGLRILPETQNFGVRYWLWILPALASISGFCTAGTARTGRISSAGTASTRSTPNAPSIYILGVKSITRPLVHRFDNSIPICCRRQLEYFECWQYFGGIYAEYR